MLYRGLAKNVNHPSEWHTIIISVPTVCFRVECLEGRGGSLQQVLFKGAFIGWVVERQLRWIHLNVKRLVFSPCPAEYVLSRRAEVTMAQTRHCVGKRQCIYQLCLCVSTNQHCPLFGFLYVHWIIVTLPTVVWFWFRDKLDNWLLFHISWMDIYWLFGFGDFPHSKEKNNLSTQERSMGLSTRWFVEEICGIVVMDVWWMQDGSTSKSTSAFDILDYGFTRERAGLLAHCHAGSCAHYPWFIVLLNHTNRCGSKGLVLK